MSLRHLRRPAARLVVALLLLAACRADAPTGDAGPTAPVTVSADLAGSGVVVLTVVVTGPGIRAPLAVNIEVPSGATTASATILVPVGGQRVFVARGYDATGEQTHEGMATVVVRPTGNDPLGIRIYARSGEVPIAVGVGDFGLTIVGGTLADLGPGDTRQLAAVVTDAQGATVPGATITWASLNPVVASVASNGRLTARAVGTTTIYASYQGLAAGSIDLRIAAIGAPVPLHGIVAAWRFSCALDAEDAAWCWGFNGNGQVGSGVAGDRARPVRVSGGQRFALLVAGFSHVCGLTLAAEAWCWGSNGLGQLGTGAATSAPTRTPQRVVGGLTFRTLAAASFKTCGIVPAGDVWCWGAGGLNAGSAVRTAPALDHPAGTVPWTGLGLSGFASCAVDAAGTPHCATNGGLNPQAGAQGIAWRELHVRDLVLDPALGWVGGSTFICGLTNVGDVRCWGTAHFGELGAGSGPLGTGAINTSVPTTVTGPQGYSALAMGGRFVCARRVANALCWGRNDVGQLGDGTTIDRHVPTAVAGGHQFTQVSASLSHACGVRSDGVALCWGDNRFGQLGDGTTTDRLVPTAVGAPLLSTP